MDRPNLKLAVATPISGRSRRAQKVHWVTGRGARRGDLVILGGAFIGVASYPAFQHGGQSLGKLLLAGISVRNILIAVLCAATWAMILKSVGVYGAIRLRSFPEYLLRWVIGLNCCTVVVGLIRLVLFPRSDVWIFMEIHWMVCFVLMASLRVFLWQRYQWTSGSRLE